MPKDSVRKFKAPKKTFGDLDAVTIADLVSASSDLALLLDKSGVIQDISLEEDDLSDYGCADWIGHPWQEVVTAESRAKVQDMLETALASGASRARQVNHPAETGNDLPVRYSTIRLAEEGRILALGRDLRPMSVLQQRLVSAQAQMETEYAQLRLAETRYQTLFQISAEAVLIVDANSLKIVEANPAAGQVLDGKSGDLTGQNFADLLDQNGLAAAQKLFANLRVSPRTDEVTVTAKNGGRFSLSASLYRDDKATNFLLRLSAQDAGVARANGVSVSGPLADIITKMPDGFVIVDQERHILSANNAFLDLAQLADEDQARGQPIERWLGRVEVDVDILIANLREYGFLRRFPTLMRGEYGGKEEIELSGVAMLSSDPPCFGLSIRKSHPALNVKVGAGAASAGPRSFEQLKELVGRVPLRELVREATDIIEQMCIEAALELTGDNRASAAEMLGLSRQSLYVKLRRHGLGELDSQESH